MTRQQALSRGAADIAAFTVPEHDGLGPYFVAVIATRNETLGIGKGLTRVQAAHMAAAVAGYDVLTYRWRHYTEDGQP